MKKLLILSIFGLMAVATIGTITSCNKENTQTSDDEETEITPEEEYVDLGLPSGIKWRSVNEINPYDSCAYFSYEEAVSEFGSSLPTRAQIEELLAFCTYKWDYEKRGAFCVSTINGKSIFLPAAGSRGCDGIAGNVGSLGSYWSSSSNGGDEACYLSFISGGVSLYDGRRCFGFAVRLVQN